ncbi:MAG: XdhC family protein [Clostridia bacterium]|nr:XdhC family protein [Clostridia bacterium]
MTDAYDALYQRALGGLRSAGMDEGLIRREWFAPQPLLIICGAGHVARELAQMAALLEMRVKVIDDRPEFANEARFPAAKVVCAPFERIGEQLEGGAYYVVATRGHQEDYRCAKAILASPHSYLGIIGSRGKAAATLARLQEDGFTKEQTDGICTPIGLDIGAQTPAEIAVSILAQIIGVKNARGASFVPREMAEAQEPGMLVIIIGKHGSAPRGVGSMMLVSGGRVVGTIGGGAVEHAAIRDARAASGAMIREYALSSAQGAALGMICGGRCTVLFIPV